MRPHATLPLIDTGKERCDMWLLERDDLPFMSRNESMKGHGMTTLVHSGTDASMCGQVG